MKKQPGKQGFIKELGKPQELPAGKAPFKWDQPLVTPLSNSGNTMRRMRENKSVAKPKSNITAEKLVVDAKRKGGQK